jgi:biotin carboxyl carrier protein
VKYRVTVQGQSYEIEVDHSRLVRVNGRPLYVELEQVGGLPVYSLALDGEGYVVFIEEGLGEYRVEVQGQVYPVEVQTKRPRLAPRQEGCSDKDGQCLVISAPLAGTLLSLPVAVGDRVAAGQAVAIVESMKMQMEVRTPLAGVVETLHGPPGRNVDQGEELVVLRSE